MSMSNLIVKVVFAVVFIAFQSLKAQAQINISLPAQQGKANATIKKNSLALQSGLPNVIETVLLEGDTTRSGKKKPFRVAFNKQIVLIVSGPSEHFIKQDSARIYINNQLMNYKATYTGPLIDKRDTAKKYFTLTSTLGKHDSTWNKWYGFSNDSLDFRVDIGTKDRQFSYSTENNLRINMFNKAGLRWAWAIVVFLFIVSILLAFVFKTDIILDHSAQADKKPYSLSRFQLLWWTVIIISCYILLFAIRDDVTLLSQTTLILLGISVTGTSFASLIDYSDSDKDRHQDKPSKGFFYDILSDNDGISVHRYQNVIFTFIFGIIFFYKVLSTGNMPEFGLLELFLMGISTAAYVGLKAGENNSPANPNSNSGSNTTPGTSVNSSSVSDQNIVG